MKISATQTITDKEGYDALLYFLDEYYKLTGNTDITDILSGASYLWGQDQPGDSAFWHYWQEAIDKVKNEGAFPMNKLGE